MLYKAKKRGGGITDLQAKMKNSFYHLFCTQNKKISLFELTSGHKRSCDSVTGSQISANLVSKYP